MRDFLTGQIFGLNGLVNLANLAFLLAFSVRDVLKLRILSLAADVILGQYLELARPPADRETAGVVPTPSQGEPSDAAASSRIHRQLVP